MGAMIFFNAASLSAHATEDIQQSSPETKSLEEHKSSFNDLLSVMEQVTEIATKTKLNADYVPGMVTVLNGKDLEARGIHTVNEALLLTPGVISAMPEKGGIMVRGVGKWISGKVKLLVNGISISDTFSATMGLLYDLQIEMVERIEIIRGPGSALYGGYAYGGVINVITRRKGREIFCRYGSFDTYGGGGLFSYANPEKTWSTSLNLSGWKSNDDDIRSGLDSLAAQGQDSFAPGPTNEKRRQQSAFITLDYHDFSLVGQYMQRGLSTPFGITDNLPPPQNRIENVMMQYMLEAKYILQPSPHLQAIPKAGWLESTMDNDKVFLRSFPTAIQPIYGPGVWNSVYEKERKFYGGIDFTWKKWEKHLLSLNLEYAHTKLVDAWQELNIDLATGLPLTYMRRYTGEQNFIKENVSRDVMSAAIQDQFELCRQLTATCGLRFDHYSDIGSNLTPRLALVYRLSDLHTLKTQFGIAFRPPTFMEMYSTSSVFMGNKDIDAETIRTYEAGYIYRDSETVGRITLFHSKLDDLIEIVGNTYQNTKGAELNGVELELEKKLTAKLKLDSNISYVKTKDLTAGQEIENSATWAGNVGLMFQPCPDYSLYLHYRHVGRRHRASGDTRNEMKSRNTLDLTGSVFNLWKEDLTLQFGVKNMFDNKILEPSPANTYPDDYPRAGRNWWMKIEIEF